MTTRARALQWIFVAVVAASTVACDSSMTATGPSGGSSSGAVITGRVNVTGNAGLTAPAQFPLAMVVAAPLANNNAGTVTVTLLGTGASTTIDGSGSFTLTDVPPGTVQLRFQGRGSDALLTISGIEEDDNLQIAVTLNGNSARLDSRRLGLARKEGRVNGRRFRLRRRL